MQLMNKTEKTQHLEYKATTKGNFHFLSLESLGLKESYDLSVSSCKDQRTRIWITFSCVVEYQ
jgi:hypothetical protein